MDLENYTYFFIIDKLIYISITGIIIYYASKKISKENKIKRFDNFLDKITLVFNSIHNICGNTGNKASTIKAKYIPDEVSELVKNIEIMRLEYFKIQYYLKKNDEHLFNKLISICDKITKNNQYILNNTKTLMNKCMEVKNKKIVTTDNERKNNIDKHIYNLKQEINIEIYKLEKTEKDIKKFFKKLLL